MSHKFLRFELTPYTVYFEAIRIFRHLYQEKYDRMTNSRYRQ